MRRMHLAEESKLGEKNTGFERIWIYVSDGYKEILSKMRRK